MLLLYADFVLQGKDNANRRQYKARLLVFISNRLLGLAWILFFRRVDFVWLLMSNSELLRIKNGQKTPYKKQKTASRYKILPLNGLMTVLGLLLMCRLFY